MGNFIRTLQFVLGFAILLGFGVDQNLAEAKVRYGKYKTKSQYCRARYKRRSYNYCMRTVTYRRSSRRSTSSARSRNQWIQWREACKNDPNHACRDNYKIVQGQGRFGDGVRIVPLTRQEREQRRAEHQTASQQNTEQRTDVGDQNNPNVVRETPESPQRETPDTQTPPPRAEEPPQVAETKTPKPQKETAIHPRKHKIDQLLSKTCEKIKGKKGRFKKKRVSKATQYFTPLFRPNSKGRLRSADRKACIFMEGSCVVGDNVYNFAGKKKKWGIHYNRNRSIRKFGKGSGGSKTYNATNALDPCRTVAADHRYYPSGTVLYVPSMDGKICPQSGKPVDGCFVVSDTGSKKHFNRPGRFDFFTGECANYNKKNNTCKDKLNKAFKPSRGASYYIVGRHNALAKELRTEADQMIRSGWETNPINTVFAPIRRLISGNR